MNGRFWLRHGIARRWARALGILFVLLCLIVLAASLSNLRAATGQLQAATQQEHQLSTCLTNWANDTTNRTQVVTNAQQARQDALDALVRTIPLHSAAAFNAALHAYLRASDAYTATLKQHPVITAPSVRC